MKKHITVCAIVFLFAVLYATANADWQHVGLPGMTINSIETNSDNFQHIFAGADIYGLYVSFNDGASWGYRIATNVPVTHISYDPWFEDSLYAIVNDSFSAGLHKSSDDGDNWEIVYNIQYPHRIGFDPVNMGYLYICFPDGIRTSQDYGRNLASANSGLPDTNVIDVMGSGLNGLEAYAVGEAFVAHTTDFGSSWSDMGGLFGLEDYNPHRIAYDPLCPETLYVVCHAYLARSSDGGSNWDYFATPSSDNFAIVCDPVSSGTLYIGSLGNGVLMSTDGGVSFASINSNLGNLYVHSLEIDPLGRLLAGTENGIYRYTEDQIPTLSEWGMLIMGLLLLASGTIAIIKRRKEVVVRSR